MSRRLAVVALVPFHGFWLGVSRKNDPNDWGLPGGKVEDGEDLRVAVAREVLEETGVHVGKTEMLRVDNVGDFTVIAFYVDTWDGHHRQQPGEGRVAWVDEASLSKGSFGAYNAARFAELRNRR